MYDLVLLCFPSIQDVEPQNPKSELEILPKMSLRSSAGHHIPVRMAQIQTVPTAEAGEGVERQELSLLAGGKAERCSDPGGQSGGFL